MSIYQKTYKITSYECDKNGFLRIRTLFNLFQDLADNHADEMGLGYKFCSPRRLGWIGGAYHVRVAKWPTWNDCLTLKTWPSKSTGVTGIREFSLQDDAGNDIVMASSQWVLVDTERMRPVSVEKNVGTYALNPVRAVDSNFEKLVAPERTDASMVEVIRQDDIDLYGHVNNAVYPTWVLDALPNGFLDKNEIAELQIQFKRSAKWGDDVLVEGELNGMESLHRIGDKSGTVEFARVKILWRKKD